MRTACPRFTMGRATGCALRRPSSAWPHRTQIGGRPSIFMLMMFKDLRPVDLVRHLEYHLLLGVEHVVYIDNSCDDRWYSKLPQAPSHNETLNSYVERGIVSIVDLRCRNISRLSRSLPYGANGGSSIAAHMLHAMPELQPPRGSLVLPLDEDEFVVLPSPSSSLREVGTQMLIRGVSASVIPWHLFGTSGHTCQPAGPVVRQFTRRAEDSWFEHNRTHGNKHPLVPSMRGKPILLWDVDCALQCSTHTCRSVHGGHSEYRWRRNCANGSEQNCLNDLGIYIAHYSFQSMQRWTLKARRGHTSEKHVHFGAVPAIFERVLDRSIASLLDERIARVENFALRRCVVALFANDDSELSPSITSAAPELPLPHPPSTAPPSPSPGVLTLLSGIYRIISGAFPT